MNKITYFDDCHLYLNSKGIIIPSVSELINFELGNEYNKVPKEVLRRASEYGTRIHELIQTYEENPKFGLNDVSMEDYSTLRDYIELKNKCGWVVNTMETIVSYQERYAGRYDMFCCDGCIYDIKTTSKLMYNHLEIQLGLYYLAMGIENDVGYCIWLPKTDIAQLVKIKPWNNEKCIDLLRRYETNN